MKPEIEVKFLQINIDSIRDRLRAAGAKLSAPMRLMRRTVFDIPPTLVIPDVYLRVRDEGDKVTMTYKSFDGKNRANEIETTVGDYDTAILLLETLGHKVKSRQESKRETWTLHDCEIVIDEWPWLSPYIEIEGPSEIALQEVAVALRLDWQKAIRGSVTTAYLAEYIFVTHDSQPSIGAIPVIAFEDPIPKTLKKRIKEKASINGR